MARGGCTDESPPVKPAPRIGKNVRQVPRRPRVKPFNYPRRWRKVRAMVLAEEPSCRLCQRPATEVHHIEPIGDGGDPYDITNLMPICKECHDASHGGGQRHS